MPPIKDKDEILKDYSGNKEASLKHNEKAFKEKVVKSINVYNVPETWIKEIEAHAAKFSSYAKLAIEEKLKRDGWIK